MNAASYRFGSPRYRKVAALATLIIAAYVGAVGRGESLLWVIAALLSATLLTGIAWPHWLVTRLSVRRTGPLRANEGETIVFRVVVENRGHLPRFMVELMDRLPFVGAADGTATAGDRVLGVVAYVAGGARRVFEVPLLCEKRGFYRLGPVSLASSFPLGLAQAQQRGPVGGDVAVHGPVVADELRHQHPGRQRLPRGRRAAATVDLSAVGPATRRIVVSR